MEYTEPEPKGVRGFDLDGDEKPIETGGEDA